MPNLDMYTPFSPAQHYQSKISANHGYESRWHAPIKYRPTLKIHPPYAIIDDEEAYHRNFKAIPATAYL